MTDKDDANKRTWDEIEQRMDESNRAAQRAIDKLVADGTILCCGLNQEGRMVYKVNLSKRKE